MTYSSPSWLSRGSSLLLSAGIHAAIGLALFAGMVASAPHPTGKKGERGQALVVELLPLPEGAIPHQGDSRAKAAESAVREAGLGEASRGQHPGLSSQFGAPPRGASADGLGEAAEAASDARGAPAPTDAEIQAFRAALLRHIERFQEYPPQSREIGEQGHVRVRFVMDRSGQVVEAWVESSSGSRNLDAESLAAIRRAQPLPAPPSHWPQSFEIALPIRFALR